MTVVADVTAPVVTVTTVNGAPATFPLRTNASVASFGGACGATAGDVALVTPLVDGVATTSVACTAGSWTVTLSPSLSSDATVALSARQSDLTGNIGTAPARSVTIDKTRPTVLSIARVGPPSVKALPVSWTVTFSEQVSGVAASNFALSMTGLSGTAPSISGVSPTSGPPSTTWTVITNTTTATAASGSIRLDLTGSGLIADATGNTLSTTTFTGDAYAYDTVRPTVTDVTSTLGNGSYKAGQVVPVTVTFSEAVTVTGTPQLALATGTPGSTAVNYASGSGSTALIFTYTVASGNNSLDLNYVATTSLTGTITDAATNTAILTLPAPTALGSLGTNKALVIDTTAPTVTSVSSSLADGRYKADQVIPVTVNFSEQVTVAGTPQLTLTTGTPATTPVSYSGGSGSTALIFNYTVVAGNTSTDLDYTGVAALALGGGSIADAAANAAVLTLFAPGAAGSLGNAKNLVIDTTAPAVTVTGVNGVTPPFPYSTNTTLQSFGGTCSAVAGDVATVAPRINGAATTPASATCASGGTWTLLLGTPLATTGTYTLSATQADAAGNVGVAPDQTVTIDRTAPTVSSIARAGASAAVNAGPLSWTVTFSEPVAGVAASNFGLVASGITGSPAISAVSASGGAPSATWTVSVGVGAATGTNVGSIRLNLTGRGAVVDSVGNAMSTTAFTGDAYTFDTTRPTVSGVSSSLANGSYRSGQVIPVDVTFSEAVTVTGTPQLTLATGSPSATAVNYKSGSGSTVLTFEYTVADGNTSADLDYAAANSLVLNGGTIVDAATNAAILTLSAPGATGSLGNSKLLVIDTTPPAVAVNDINSFSFFGLYFIQVTGTAEPGAGPATVFLCLNSGSPCDSGTATRTFTGLAVNASGAWQTNWTNLGVQGNWYARVTQTDPAGNVGTSAVFGPIPN